MRSNREEAKPALTAGEETGQVKAYNENDAAATQENKVFDIRKKHSDNPPPPTQEEPKPSGTEEHKVFDIRKKHSDDPPPPTQEEAKAEAEAPKEVGTEEKKVFDIRKKHSDNPPPPTKEEAEALVQHGPEPKPADPAPATIHVENHAKQAPVYKAASNFVVVEPKKESTKEPAKGVAAPVTLKDGEVHGSGFPMGMRNKHHGQHPHVEGSSGTGWMSFLLAVAIIVSFLFAVASFILQGGHFFAGKDGKVPKEIRALQQTLQQALQQVQDLFQKGSSPGVSRPSQNPGFGSWGPGAKDHIC